MSFEEAFPVFIKVSLQRTRGSYWFMFDAGIAMEHIVLAAWVSGLEPSMLGNFDAKAEAVLKIPDGFNMVE